jgi:ferredoxin-NADP reductase
VARGANSATLATDVPVQRFPWLPATVTEVRSETTSGHTTRFAVPGGPGHLADQHVNIRLTPDDGYTVEHNYSIANAADGTDVDLTVQRVPDGEASTYVWSSVGSVPANPA